MTSSWRSLIGATLRLDTDRIDLGGALRCTIGVVIPLVVGLATGAVGDGVAAAVGALCAGFASFQGAYRSRAAITLVVAAGMAVSTVVGATASHHDVSAILVTALWGGMAGMMASLGQGALVTGMQWVVAELIVGVIPMTLSQAAVRGLMIFAGGVVQTILVVVVWPFGTYVVERRSLQAAYADLARYAEQVADGMDVGSGAVTLDDARAALGDPQPFSNAARLLAFQALVDEAERIRIETAALARHRSRISAQPAEVLSGLLAHAAVVLRCVARALGRDEEPRVPVEVLSGLARDCDDFGDSLRATREPAWLVTEASAATEALAGQLRSAIRLAFVSAGRSDPIVEGRDLPMRRHLVVRESLLTLRANLAWRSATFRHALRLAVTLALAMAIYRESGLSHGYWIPLTALVVLRPDFTSTAVRGLSRIAGTIIGAGLATLIAALIRPDQVGLAALFSGASFAAFILMRANYAAFSVAVTSFVVFLLAFVKLPEITAVSDRLVDTLLGGALAIAAYLVWPTWESRLVGPQLAALLDAQADYSHGVLSVWIDPGTERRSLAGLRTSARLARSNAEASVDRMTSEPARSLRSAPLRLEQARGVVAAARSLSLAILSLHAQVPPRDAPPCPDALPLACALDERARSEAARLAGGSDWGEGGEPAVSLRQLHGTMADVLRARSSGMDDRTALLVEETDLMVDGLNMISVSLGPRSSRTPL